MGALLQRLAALFFLRFLLKICFAVVAEVYRQLAAAAGAAAAAAAAAAGRRTTPPNTTKKEAAETAQCP